MLKITPRLFQAAVFDRARYMMYLRKQAFSQAKLGL